MPPLPPGGDAVSARVVCRIRTGVTVSFEIGEKPAFMGRDKAVAVSVPAEGVSRHHARISWDGKGHWLEDLKSTNGTFLNGKAVSRERLYHLDVITLGKTLDLVFLQQEAGASPQKVKGIVRAALVREGGEAAPHEVARGEVTLGRAQSCNIVAEAASVSKVHARVERTRDQLVIEDLGSANGTFVNGLRVMSAFLNDGDVVSLGGVENYKVTVEMGEVAGASGRFSASIATNTANRPRFSADWKTRYDWSTTEQNELAQLRERLAEEDKVRQEQRTRRNPVVSVRPSAKEAPKAQAPAAGKSEKAAAAVPIAKPGAAPVPVGARTAPPPPAAPPKAAAPAPPPPRAPSPPPAAPPNAAPPAAAPASPPAAVAPPSPPSPPAPKPVVTPAAPAPAPAATPPPPRITASPPAVAPAAPKPASTGSILEVRLSAADIDLVVKEPGAHDLGRSSEMELRVSHPTVSRRHARIILSDDRAMVYVQDQGGANGTRLNGKEVAKLAPLSEGDKIGIGDLELKVSLKRG
jgi:pSer/pThr/pTyr-binding forkhead associated (FHA) protein